MDNDWTKKTAEECEKELQERIAYKAKTLEERLHLLSQISALKTASYLRNVKYGKFGGVSHPNIVVEDLTPPEPPVQSQVNEACHVLFRTLNNSNKMREYIQTLDKMREVNLAAMCRYGHSTSKDFDLAWEETSKFSPKAWKKLKIKGTRNVRIVAIGDSNMIKVDK